MPSDIFSIVKSEHSRSLSNSSQKIKSDSSKFKDVFSKVNKSKNIESKNLSKILPSGGLKGNKLKRSVDNIGFKNLVSSRNNIKSSDDGTDIATKKMLREFATGVEKYFHKMMWKAAFENVPFKEKSVSDILYGSEYMDKIMDASYGDDGGKLADDIYKNLLNKYKLEE